VKKTALCLAGKVFCALYAVVVSLASCWMHTAQPQTIQNIPDQRPEPVLNTHQEGTAGTAEYPLGLLMADSAPQEPAETQPSLLYSREEDSCILPLSLHNTDPFALSNETDYTPDLPQLLRKSAAEEGAAVFLSSSTGDQPLVLVLHTHGTESYALEGLTAYPENYGFRTDDPTQNVVAVGECFTQTLIDREIAAIHCPVMHDAESYIYAYSSAAETIRAYLEKYPSIRYVIDLHRDALERQDGTILRPVVASPEGIPTAQIMVVVGTDDRGGNHPHWQTNLSLAVRLQSKMEERCPTITRPINLRGATFNQQYTPGSLLVEIGSTGNTLEEAKEAAVIAAHALADIIKKE